DRACCQLTLSGSVPPKGESFTWQKQVGSILVTAYPLGRCAASDDTKPLPKRIGPTDAKTDKGRSTATTAISHAVEHLLEASTATVCGAGEVGPAIGATVAGVVVRSAFRTVPDGLGCGNRIRLSPASANVKCLGPFRPLAIVVCVFVDRSIRVIVPASLLT